MAEQGTIDPVDRAELARRRQDFWRWVWRIAIGVLLGLLLYTAVVYIVLVEAIDSDEPSITLDE